MNVTSFALNITSEQPEVLDKFYTEVVGLERDPISGGFKTGPTVGFLVDGHSETKGSAQEPYRALINFWVEDVKAERERLEARGVQFIRREGVEYWGGVISTFLDPDGNYCQLMMHRPELARSSSEEHETTEAAR